MTQQQREAAAWFTAGARPERPLPRSATRTTRDSARFVTAQAHDRAAQHPDSRPNPAALASLAGVSNPRPGLRRWVLSTLGLRAGRETYAELYDDGTVVLAANLTFRTSRDHFRDDDHLPAGLFVHQGHPRRLLPPARAASSGPRTVCWPVGSSGSSRSTREA
ncbi:hypothetical protein [Streptomyces coelicoflavus]